MRPVKTPETNVIYTLPGGNEDNFLHACRVDAGHIYSDWELKPNERALIRAGARLRLTILTEPIPPVALELCPPACRTCKAGMELAGEVKSGFRFVCLICGESAVPFRDGTSTRIPTPLARRLRKIVAKSISILDEQPPSQERDASLEEFTAMFYELLAAT